MCKDWTKSSQCFTNCVWFSQILSQNYQLLQQMSGKLILFSMIRHNVYFIQFTKKCGSDSVDYHRFGCRCQTLQYNPRSCYMQTRWPTHPTIFLPVGFYAGSQLPITNANILRMKSENISWKFCNRRTGFGKEIFLAMGIETTFVHPMIYTRCS